MSPPAFWSAASLIVIVPAVHAGQDETDFDGPAAPISPAVISRDASGRATIRAVRITTPLRVDGRLDESLYTSVPPISDFIQQEPAGGRAGDREDRSVAGVRRDNLYVAFRCWESEPERVVANEMRRDATNIFQGNDIVAFMPRHVPRPPQRVQVHHQPDRRP